MLNTTAIEFKYANIAYQEKKQIYILQMTKMEIQIF